MVHHLLQVMTVVTVGAALTGCSQGVTGLYDDYLDRLGNVLNTPRLDWRPPAPDSAPRSSELSLSIPDVRMNPVNYWNVRHCELFNLISERNSILGRIAPSNQVWRYEARVLAALESCANHTDTRANMAEELETWQQAKLTAWPEATWNGTLASSEVRDLWRADADGWAPDRIPTLTALRADLSTLSHWASAWPRSEIPDADTFSTVYQRLGQHNHGGQWRRSVQISHSGLSRANDMLSAALEADSLCPSRRRTRDAEHAQNVLILVFIGEIQPYIASINGRGEQLLADLSALTESIDVSHVQWNLFMDQLRQELADLQDISRTHAGLWQETLERCQIRIGQT